MVAPSRLPRPAAFALALVLGVGCGGTSAPTAVAGAQGSAATSVRTGAWGGDRVSLDVAADGAFVEFDCAHGRVEEPLVLDRDGRFDARGTYVQERGGPQRDGDEAGRSIRYRGRVADNSMTLTVVFGEGKELGPFTLSHGSRGVFRKCL